MGELIWSVDGPQDGAANMDRDSGLWRSFEADPRPGIRLRIYGWSPPALSLGFHQSMDEVDRDALRRRGYDLVRRPTGGAAVLHVDEITWAVAAPLGLPGLGRGVLEIYAAIAAAMVEAFAGLGLDVKRGGGGVPRTFACFSAAGGHEMTVDGRKLAGSALRRGRRAFLQHGSILRGDGHLELHDFLRGIDPAEREGLRAALAASTCTLDSLGMTGFGAEVLGASLSDALAERTGLATRQVDPWRQIAEPS